MNLVHIDLILLEKGDSYPPEVVQPPLVLCSLQYFSVAMAVSWLASTHTHTPTRPCTSLFVRTLIGIIYYRAPYRINP